MLETLENPPSIEETKHDDHLIEGEEEKINTRPESSHLLDHKVISIDSFGYLLTWNALM